MAISGPSEAIDQNVVSPIAMTDIELQSLTEKDGPKLLAMLSKIAGDDGRIDTKDVASLTQAQKDILAGMDKSIIGQATLHTGPSLSTADATKLNTLGGELKSALVGVDKTPAPAVTPALQRDLATAEGAVEPAREALKATTTEQVQAVNAEIARKTDAVITLEYRDQGDTLSQKDIESLDTIQKFIAQVANFNGDRGIERSNDVGLMGRMRRIFDKRYDSGRQEKAVGESQVYTLLTSAEAAKSGALDAVMTRLIEATDKTPENAKKLQDAILKKVGELQMLQDLITGAADKSMSTDLMAVLTGKTEQYINAILNDPTTYQKLAEQAQKNPSGFAQKMKTVMEQIPAIGATIAAASMGGYVRTNTHELTSDGNSSGPLQRSFGSGNFTVSGGVDLSAARVGLNVNDSEHKMNEEIKRLRQEIADTKGDQTKIDDLITRELGNNEAADKVKDFYKTNKDKIPAESLATLLSQAKMISFAQDEAGKGVQLKGVEGLLSFFGGAYVGLSFDKFSTNFAQGNDGIAQRVAEEIGKQNLSFEPDENGKYSALNGQIGYENKDGKHIYTFPANAKFTEIQNQATKMGANVEQNGEKLVVTSDTPIALSIKSSIAVNGDMLMAIMLKKQERAVPKIEASVPVDKIQDQVAASDVLRDVEKRFADRVYTLNRNNPRFDKIMVEISKGQYDSAAQKLQSQFPDVFKQLFANPIAGYDRDQWLNALLTYTYGAKNVRNRSEANQNLYKEARSAAVLAAESAQVKSWAPGSSYDIASSERAFAQETKHTSTHLSKLIAGQELAVSVIATPYNHHKDAGTNRIDHFSGSVEVSQKTIDITDPKVKEQLLVSHDKQVQEQLAKLNSFTGKNISIDDYKAMLLGEKTPDQVLPGLKFQEGKAPKFFEARAMVRESACLNATFGLAYPLFSFAQKVETPVVAQDAAPSIEATVIAPTGNEGARKAELGVGVGVDQFQGSDESTKQSEGGRETTPGHEEVDPISTNPTGDATGNVVNVPTTPPVAGAGQVHIDSGAGAPVLGGVPASGVPSTPVSNVMTGVGDRLPPGVMPH